MPDPTNKPPNNPGTGATAAPNRHQPAPIPGPALPPSMTEPKQSIEELAKDLKKSPFFMTSADDKGEQPNFEYDAIMALRNEGTRLQRADNAREEGNDRSRAGQWKLAREQYDAGLARLKETREPGDPTGSDEDKKESHLKEILLVNCAQCNLQLKNYRMCINNCDAALKINPNNIKAHFRKANALVSVDKLDEAEAACQPGLAFATETHHFEMLLKRIAGKRSSRIEAQKHNLWLMTYEKSVKETLEGVLSDRGIKVSSTGAKPYLGEGRVKLIGDSFRIDGPLGIPLMVYFPLVRVRDLIEEFNDTRDFLDCMEILFPFHWDKKQEYGVEDMVGFLETSRGKLARWEELLRLRDYIQRPIISTIDYQVEIRDEHVKLFVLPKKHVKAWKKTLAKERFWTFPGDADEAEGVPENAVGTELGEDEYEEGHIAAGGDPSEDNRSEDDTEEDDEDSEEDEQDTEGDDDDSEG